MVYSWQAGGSCSWQAGGSCCWHGNWSGEISVAAKRRICDGHSIIMSVRVSAHLNTLITYIPCSVTNCFLPTHCSNMCTGHGRLIPATPTLVLPTALSDLVGRSLTLDARVGLGTTAMIGFVPLLCATSLPIWMLQSDWVANFLQWNKTYYSSGSNPTRASRVGRPSCPQRPSCTSRQPHCGHGRTQSGMYLRVLVLITV